MTAVVGRVRQHGAVAKRGAQAVRPFEPTAGEVKVANRVVVADAVAFLPALIATNVTGSWLFVVTYLGLLIVTTGATILWCARTRSEPFWRTVRAIMRR